NFREISSEIMTIETAADCDGYRIARAIYNAEVGRTGYTEAFEVLDSYKDDSRFINAVIKLRNVLDNDETIRLLAEYKGTERAEIQQYLAEIGG
ncbi:MAG TPA: serine/threonine protein kinase, partial [Ruminococcus sp.]|nr:serine/threonine protein kinase [Ruminococcus sp.]